MKEWDAARITALDTSQPTLTDFMNKTHTHGILHSQIVLDKDEHVLLFAPAQKTDSTASLMVVMATVVLMAAVVSMTLLKLRETTLLKVRI